MKKFALIFLALCLALTGCQTQEKEAFISQFESKTETINGYDYRTRISEAGTFQITNTLPPSSYLPHPLEDLPSLKDSEDKSSFTFDIRGQDLSHMDLENRLEDLLYADFDSKTLWPEKLPEGFDIEKIMAYGKDPGLGIRALHEEGITGKNVGIAIIDQGLLTGHIEYKDRLKLYEEIHCSDDEAKMHGSAVASIAVGKNVGVAPEADLYYIGAKNGIYENDELINDNTSYAHGIERILEINAQLPEDQKIRVISMSLGFLPEHKGYDAVTKAIEKARTQKIYVVYSGSYNMFGAGRNPLEDPNDKASFNKGQFWKNYDIPSLNLIKNTLVPMDSRCYASNKGTEDYEYCSVGGISWSIPYIAGLYALACEVDPSITPEKFEQTILSTRTAIETSDNENLYLLNPKGLIDALKKEK